MLRMNRKLSGCCLATKEEEKERACVLLVVPVCYLYLLSATTKAHA
jgi:hypothetical protein